ncbi:MAG TPA: ABC transporter substrate-binding protein [Pseudonocardia sp.]
MTDARTPRRARHPRWCGALLAVAAGALLAACSGPAPESGGGSGSAPAPAAPAVAADPALQGLVPQVTRDAGVVKVGTNAPYAPFIDFAQEGDTTAFKGLDHDLMQAASAKLGLKVQFVQQPFDGLVPGLQAGNYDAIAGGITDNKQRQEVATFVDYSASGTGFLTTAGNPKAVKGVPDLCGKRVAVQKASNQEENLNDYSKQSCPPGSPITVSGFPENPQAVNAMLAGNADVVAATTVALPGIVSQLAGRVELVQDAANPNGWQASPNGIGFLKSRGDLAAAYQKAIQALVDDGTYAKILDSYQQKAIALPTITVDKAVD